MLENVDRTKYERKGEKFQLERIARYFDNYIGEEGNLWNDEQTGDNGFSKVVDTENLSNINIMGVLYGDTSLNIYFSVNEKRFYYDPNLSQEFVSEEIPEVPPWETRTQYRVGDMVEYEYDGSLNIYTCNDRHRSDDTFEEDEEKWDLTFENIDSNTIEEFSFYIGNIVGGRYIQLQSTNDVRATATLIAKP